MRRVRLTHSYRPIAATTGKRQPLAAIAAATAIAIANHDRNKTSIVLWPQTRQWCRRRRKEKLAWQS